MTQLSGKRILFCRDQSDNAEFHTVFRDAGATIDYFAGCKYQLVRHSLLQRAVKSVSRLNEFDWLLLSSSRAVEMLATLLRYSRISADELAATRIGMVGQKSTARFEAEFPGIDVSEMAWSLQELIDKVRESCGNGPLRLLHLSSRQSLQHVKIDLPPRIKLSRVPMYETVANDNLTRAEKKKVLQAQFDVIVFSSPTSFNYFRQLAGEHPSLACAAVAAFGSGTAEYIRGMGYTVSIVPKRPTASELIRAMIEHFRHTNAENSRQAEEQSARIT